jgi:anti-anti-sigma factor
VQLVIKQVAGAGSTGGLEVSGSIDLTTREEFLNAGLRALETQSALDLDLSQVEFIDSVGIGALIELGRVAKSQQKAFVVSGRSRRVQRVLEATGLQDQWS